MVDGQRGCVGLALGHREQRNVAAAGRMKVDDLSILPGSANTEEQLPALRNIDSTAYR